MKRKTRFSFFFPSEKTSPTSLPLTVNQLRVILRVMLVMFRSQREIMPKAVV